MNLGVVSLFWAFSHQESLATCHGNILKIINIYWTNLVPAFSIASNFALTDVVVRRSHYKGIVAIAVVYGFFNYLQIK